MDEGSQERRQQLLGSGTEFGEGLFYAPNVREVDGDTQGEAYESEFKSSEMVFECGKGSKKSFVPPTQKLHMISQGPNSPQEHMTLEMRPSDAIAEPVRLKTKLEKEEKATTENESNSGWEIKGKAQDKPMEKKEKEKTSLTNAEFEEIVQIVLQKSLQDCLGQCLVWVQCSLPNCKKWRRLSGDIDPSILPDDWICDQNPDLAHNRCDIPEENWTEYETEVAYASYIPGSMIWAKQYGYPWWPGMVESDPDLGEYFLFASHLDFLPSKYHVTFFGDTVSRAWIPINMLKNFQELPLELIGMKKYKNKDYSQKLGAAIMMAHKAEQVNVQTRVNLFGFWNRYGRSDNSGGKKEVMPSKANNPESGLKKKKREKKNPTLPGPKSGNKQTKKAKPTGMADEQDRPLKKRMKRRSLGSESVDASAPIFEKEEEPKNTDEPGCKTNFQAPQSKASAPRLSKEKEVRMVPQGQAPPACHRPGFLLGKAWPSHPELLAEEVIHVPAEEGESSDLDFEQLMEDIGREAEERGELQHGDSAEDFPMALFE
ncbi:zinc finger CW-type PWWP domain protein 1 [Dipodomys spectabilis]|uniref:zinc finger CW-type PWWP domain protein 1 n=1 Tax=Dipodomys spectabilis TaxID=105255 RepID=UPI001C5416AA|nr:zinc finger CW-type PWWP domain protein 1 [Dipodomys spectabilis]